MANPILLFGGNSDERLVSVASAQNVAKVVPFFELWFIHPSGGISKVSQTELTEHRRPFEVALHPKQKPFCADLREALPFLKDKVVFIGLHGTEGEDGAIQSFFESEKIPFTGSGSRGSRLCFNKVQAKEVVSGAKLPVAPQITFLRESAEAIRQRLIRFFKEHGAIVVKPVASGSSFGLHVLEKESQIAAAAEAVAKSNYDHFMAEKFVRGRELTVGVIERGGKLVPLPPSEVVLQHGASFDYNGKYLGRGSKEITPARLTPEDTAAAQKLALEAHRVLGCSGYSRTDMILTPLGPVFLETNTLPGLTAASFIPQQLAAAGIEVRDFIAEQLELAKRRPRN
jgi:D-alanine-D-alanine ligase